MTSRLAVCGSLCALALLAACEQGQLSRNPPNHAPALPPRPHTAQASQPLGEVVSGYPNDHERMVHVLTNLSRHAPNNECGDWTAEQAQNAPKPPLIYSGPANYSARWTSKHNADVGCFDPGHDTCCVLGDTGGGTIGCTAAASCSADQCGKECSGGTGAAQRHQLLGHATYSGENIARGQTSAAAVWCGWMKSDGHRKNIYSNHTELGVGLAQATGGCGLYWTQAFGSGGGGIPRIPVASAMYAPPNPQVPQSLYFAANYWDPAAKPPRRAAVVVGGHCFDLTQAWGVDGNATFEARFSSNDDLPPGCHPYYFLFVDDAADRHTYPDNGSLYVALGNGESCPAPYDAGQLPADCETGVQSCAEGEVRSCYTGPENTENVGLCRGGMQTCKNGFWSACSQQKRPAPEECDGQDNDCDGEVDEGNPGGGIGCKVAGERGECQAGEKQCIGGAEVCVSTYQPQVEVCDNLDNDCDGPIDDGFNLEKCGVGECFRMVSTCVNGQEQSCVPGTPSAEVADGKDNDCDGVIDNGVDCRRPLEDGGFQSGFARNCYSFPTSLPDGGIQAPQLPCKRGFQLCGEDGVWGACTGEVGPSPEVCDGVDNDCDGITDNNQELGWQRCGTGWCTVYAQQCRVGKPFTCVPSQPAEETCDGNDQDCDGEVDEGCSCRDGITFPCYTGPMQTIDAGVCHAGANVCSGGKWPGCQNQVVPSTEYCNQQDDDCDGLVDNACVAAPPPDAGVDAGFKPGGADAGWTELPDAGVDGGGGGADGCGCQSSGASLSTVLFGLFAFALAARRRRGSQPASGERCSGS